MTQQFIPSWMHPSHQSLGILDNDNRVEELGAVKRWANGEPRVVLTLEVCDG